MKFDMHCHSKEGSIDGAITIEDSITRLIEKGYNGMLISDHNSYKAYRYWEKNIKDHADHQFIVLKGIEYDTINCGHILIILPTGTKVPLLEIKGLPVALLIEIVHYYGGICGPAHPCGEKYLSLTRTRWAKKHRNIMEKFDFIETFNACESPESNEKARKLAESLHLPGFGGSDSHRFDCVGLGFTEFSQEIHNETDVIQAVCNHSLITCGGAYYKKTTKQHLGKLNDLLIYSFWFYNKITAGIRFHKRRFALAHSEYRMNRAYIQLPNEES